MILSLLDIPIIESSDVQYKINLNVALGYENKSNYKNIDSVVEQSYNDPDDNKLILGDNVNMESNINKILKAYQFILND